jgi:hypothetical protein
MSWHRLVRTGMLPGYHCPAKGCRPMPPGWKCIRLRCRCDPSACNGSMVRSGEYRCWVINGKGPMATRGSRPAEPERKMPWYFIGPAIPPYGLFWCKDGLQQSLLLAGGRPSPQSDDGYPKRGGGGSPWRQDPGGGGYRSDERAGKRVYLPRPGVFAACCAKSRGCRAQPVYGINDWYYAYGNNNPELILRQTG